MIKLSPQELQTNTLDPDTLQIAVEQVRVNGYTIFESVLPADFVTVLREEYMEIYDEALKTPPEKTFGKNHFRLYLPFRPPFTDARIINSPFALPVFEALLGPEMVSHYFASNTCAPGSDFQPVHADTYNLYPELDVVVPPFMMVLNIPLVDTTLDNGPMDIWEGTHASSVARSAIEKIAPHLPAQPATMPAGSIMIRDGRMWHRGTRNNGDAPRPNIAIVYVRPWVASGPKRIGIPQATYDALPPRLQQIYQQENIGGPLDEPW